MINNYTKHLQGTKKETYIRKLEEDQRWQNLYGDMRGPGVWDGSANPTSLWNQPAAPLPGWVTTIGDTVFCVVDFLTFDQFSAAMENAQKAGDTLYAEGLTVNSAGEIILSTATGTVRIVTPAFLEGYLAAGAVEGVASETVNALRLTKSSIDEAVEFVMKDENKMWHIFQKSGHKLDGLVSSLGSEENVVRAVLEAAKGKLPASGVFENISVQVGEVSVIIRGRVIDGVPRIGTFFIP